MIDFIISCVDLPDALIIGFREEFFKIWHQFGTRCPQIMQTTYSISLIYISLRDIVRGKITFCIGK